jgi:Cdc6-like AAA superfamily ATPase
LLGRQREQAVLERLLVTALSGHGAVLAVYGDPGVGKTALLDHAVLKPKTSLRVEVNVGVSVERGYALTGSAAGATSAVHPGRG